MLDPKFQLLCITMHSLDKVLYELDVSVRRLDENYDRTKYRQFQNDLRSLIDSQFHDVEISE